jgi:hypothetical protein
MTDSPAFYITNQRCRNCRSTTATLDAYNLAYLPAILPLNWNTQCPRIYDCPCPDSHHSDTTYTHTPMLQISWLASKAQAGQIGKKQVREMASQLNPLTYTALTWYNHDKCCKNGNDHFKTWALRIQTPPLCLRHP